MSTKNQVSEKKKKTTSSTSSKAVSSSEKQRKSSVKKMEAKSVEQEHTFRVFVGLILIFAAVFSVLGWFNKTAYLLRLLFRFETGLLGYGAYLLPALFVWLSTFLFRKDNEKSNYRILMVSAIPLFTGAVAFAFSKYTVDWQNNPVQQLWNLGAAGNPAGVFSGMLGGLLISCLGKVGGGILFAFLTILSVLAFFNITLPQLITAFQDEAPVKEKNETDNAKLIAQKVYQKAEDVSQKRSEIKKQKSEQAEQAPDEHEVQPRTDFRLVSFDEDNLPDENEPVKKVEQVKIVTETLHAAKTVPAKTRKQIVPQQLHISDIPINMVIPDDDDTIIDKSRKCEIIPRRGESEKPLLTANEEKTVNSIMQVDRTPLTEDSVMKEFDPGNISEIDTAVLNDHLSAVEPLPSITPDFEDNESNSIEMDDSAVSQNDFESVSILPEIQPESNPSDEESYSEAEDELPFDSAYNEEFKPEPDKKPDHALKETLPQQAAAIVPSIQQIPQEKPYVFPPVELLQPGSSVRAGGLDEAEENKNRLMNTLKSFGVNPVIKDIVKGPTVTRYELQLDVGVKLSKITSLSDDIALALGVSSVRISAIPDKISVVGIEVPNKTVSIVRIREVLDSVEFEKHKSDLAFAAGKDIAGNRVIGNIAKMPHLLVAGTTGSGKSVCMNSIIISLLYKAKPDDVKLIMVDPKMVELGIYNGIPHLMLPVVTDPKKASGTLQWAVSEMLRRYSLMAERGTRDIAGYNASVENDPERSKLPKLVIIIDELADLMMACAKEVEESICRIAQMGRAAGVHLIVATQRPSANVITGLMKANIPSRIAFAVASAMESRIILDSSGAEKLVGKGDMLFAPLGEGKARRVQGCFITDEEVEKVVTFIKEHQGTVTYDQKLQEEINRKAAATGKQQPEFVSSDEQDSGDDRDDRDELIFDAVDVILETQQASVSVLQRKLKVGYARASRIVDQIEEMGIIGPHKGSKPRDILISKEKWQAKKEELKSI